MTSGNPFENYTPQQPQQPAGSPQPYAMPQIPPGLSKRQRKAYEKKLQKYFAENPQAAAAYQSAGYAGQPAQAPQQAPQASQQDPQAPQQDPTQQAVGTPQQDPNQYAGFAQQQPPAKGWMHKLAVGVGLFILVALIAVVGVFLYEKMGSDDEGEADVQVPISELPVTPGELGAVGGQAGTDPEMTAPVSTQEEGDFTFSEAGCKAMWSNEDWLNYWRCVKGDVKLGAVVDTPIVPDMPIVMYDPFKGHVPSSTEPSILFGTTYYLTPDSTTPGLWLLSQGPRDNVRGIFTKDPSLFTQPELKAMFDPLNKNMIPSRISAQDEKYDGMVGVAFGVLKYCGDSADQCKALYERVGGDDNQIPNTGTTSIEMGLG